MVEGRRGRMERCFGRWVFESILRVVLADLGAGAYVVIGQAKGRHTGICGEEVD